jgi:hypothetical protein
MRNGALLVLLLVLGPWTEARAQVQLPEIPVGARIRIFSPALGDQPTIGQFAGFESESLWLLQRPSQTTLQLPIASITRLEVSDGHHRWRRAGIGALAGLGGSIALAVVCIAVCAPGEAMFAPIGGVLYGVFVGAPLGAVVGAVFAPERWRPLPIE